jgi:hypothetical protein
MQPEQQHKVNEDKSFYVAVSDKPPDSLDICNNNKFVSHDLEGKKNTYFFDSLLRGGIRASFHRILGL